MDLLNCNYTRITGQPHVDTTPPSTLLSLCYFIKQQSPSPITECINVIGYCYFHAQVSGHNSCRSSNLTLNCYFTTELVANCSCSRLTDITHQPFINKRFVEAIEGTDADT